METAALDDVRAWPGLDVFDREGERIGRLAGIYVTTDSSRPEFGLVRTGLFGLRSVLVPLVGAFEEGGALIVDLDKNAVKGAPHLRRDEPLSDEAEERLYAHYGLDHETMGFTFLGRPYEADPGVRSCVARHRAFQRLPALHAAPPRRRVRAARFRAGASA